METVPVNLKTAADVKMNVALAANGSTFFLTLMGSGKGTNTVDINNETVFVLDDDSTVTVKSVGVQGFESRNFVNTYKHDYTITQNDLAILSRHNLRRVRKYSMAEFADIVPDEKAAANLKALSAFFWQELKKANLLKLAQSEPAFPGGKDVWLAFLNRNLKAVQQWDYWEKKSGVVTFQVGADGSIDRIGMKESAGAIFDNELLRILKRMPKWKPAVENGSRVAALVTQRVTFYRQDKLIRVKFEDNDDKAAKSY
ncbi:MAG TPA: energy transducer TonB [Flavisolibacter sp.]|nr:energy transducer TonB [Flavisolibacter sp.]